MSANGSALLSLDFTFATYIVFSYGSYATVRINSGNLLSLLMMSFLRPGRVGFGDAHLGQVSEDNHTGFGCAGEVVKFAHDPLVDLMLTGPLDVHPDCPQ